MAQIYIPSILMSLTDNLKSFETGASTVGEAFRELTGKFPAIEEKLFETSKKFREHVLVFVGDDDISDLEGFETELSKRDEISIIVAMAGG